MMWQDCAWRGDRDDIFGANPNPNPNNLNPNANSNANPNTNTNTIINTHDNGVAGLLVTRREIAANENGTDARC